MRTLGSPSASTVASAIASGSEGSLLRASSNQAANRASGSSASVKSPAGAGRWSVGAKSDMASLASRRLVRRALASAGYIGEAWTAPMAGGLRRAVLCLFRVANPQPCPHIGDWSGRGWNRRKDRSCQRCATPMKCWGFRRMPMRRRSRAPSGASPRSCIPMPTRTIPRPPSALPSSIRPTRFSARRRSAGPTTPARSMPRASRAFTASARVSAAQVGAGRRRVGRPFRDVLVRARRASRARGGVGGGQFEDIIGQMFGGFGAARGRSFRGGFEPDEMEPQPRRDDLRHHFARGGRHRRHPARPPADRQGGRRQDSGRPRRRQADQAQGQRHSRARAGPATS